MNKRHIHADLIHAWAEGAEIQYRKDGRSWVDIHSPSFEGSGEYRIKPRTVRREINLLAYLDADQLFWIRDTAVPKQPSIRVPAEDKTIEVQDVATA